MLVRLLVALTQVVLAAALHRAGRMVGGLAGDVPGAAHTAVLALTCAAMFALALQVNLRFARVLGDWTLTVTLAVALSGGVGLLQVVVLG